MYLLNNLVDYASSNTVERIQSCEHLLSQNGGARNLRYFGAEQHFHRAISDWAKYLVVQMSEGGGTMYSKPPINLAPISYKPRYTSAISFP